MLIKNNVKFSKTRYVNRLITYICSYIKTKMNFIKSANILQILLLILVLSSCAKEKKIELNDAQLPKDVLPKNEAFK